MVQIDQRLIKLGRKPDGASTMHNILTCAMMHWMFAWMVWFGRTMHDLERTVWINRSLIILDRTLIGVICF